MSASDMLLDAVLVDPAKLSLCKSPRELISIWPRGCSLSENTHHQQWHEQEILFKKYSRPETMIETVVRVSLRIFYVCLTN